MSGEIGKEGELISSYHSHYRVPHLLRIAGNLQLLDIVVKCSTHELTKELPRVRPGGSCSPLASDTLAKEDGGDGHRRRNLGELSPARTALLPKSDADRCEGAMKAQRF